MFLYCRWIHCAVLLAVVSVALSKDDNLLITTVKSIGQWFKCVRFKLSGHHTRTPALCLPESSLCQNEQLECCRPYRCSWEANIQDYICKVRDIFDILHTISYYLW
ncbi:uncharacterized protein LOC124369290 [Homalodisca vitripennis]|uniref:uncharacterized protein LOC124369290 n=1 Tax=Homalodisca vitripennis TaxID=197043 RepID=UPI001EE9B9E4|nr:uncharacterized protein LOC124369290 [Homalodisca vitripennis]